MGDSPFAAAPGADLAAGEHMVFAGQRGERVPSLAAAVARVEQLANDGVTEAQVYALVPVPLQMKQVWRVDVGATPAPAPVLSAPPTWVPTAPPPPAEPLPADVPAASHEPAADETASPDGEQEAFTPEAFVPESVGAHERPSPLEAPAERADVLPQAPAQRGRGIGFFVH